MKVLFIFRNAEWLGIEYLSAVLKKSGHTVELLFNPGACDIEFKMPFLEKMGNIDEEIIKNPVRALNEDLDSLPFPDKVAVFMEKEYYLSNKKERMARKPLRSILKSSNVRMERILRIIYNGRR